VLEIVNGSKPTWRETCVSELEVWGLPGPSAAKLSGKQKPVVQIGTLEPLPVLSEADCVRLLFPAAHGRHIADDDQAGGVEVLPIGRDTFVCHVIHGEAVDQPEGDKQHEVAVVAGKRRAVLAGRVSETTTGSHDDSTMIVETGAFAAALVPLTATETALLVEISRGRGGPMLSDSVTSSTLYRITKTGLDPVLAFKSSRVGGESSDDDVCVLQVGKPRAPLPDVDLQCTKTEGRWHHEDPRGDGLFDEVRTEHYRWDGTRYARR
jgi:hypothetical protein